MSIRSVTVKVNIELYQYLFIEV